MQNDIFVFTEIINCAEVGKIAIESFHKHHDQKIYIFATNDDIAALGDIAQHKNNIFINVTDNKTLLQLYKSGHRGTAYVFAKVFSGEMYPDFDKIIHFDSDIYFKDECLSIITNKFDEGYEIVGSRRCYVNNPGGIVVPPGISDTVSTYFYGMKRHIMPDGYSFDQLVDMFQGHNTGLDHMVFDFADCITFHALKKGSEICFINSNLIGGQDEYGSKANHYPSNLYLDAGSCLVHFGGAGSGCAYSKDREGKNETYGKWALIRYQLHCVLFWAPVPSILTKDDYSPPVFDAKGRWVSGCYNQQIVNLITWDINTDPVGVHIKIGQLDNATKQNSNLDAAVNEYATAISNRNYDHNTVVAICKKYTVGEKELKARYRTRGK